MIRNTLQRRAISRVFSVDVPPLTPYEVLLEAQQDIPALGIATVYRTLKSMVESGTLVVVNLPGEAARYELAEKKHHHFYNGPERGQARPLAGDKRGKDRRKSQRGRQHHQDMLGKRKLKRTKREEMPDMIDYMMFKDRLKFHLSVTGPLQKRIE